MAVDARALGARIAQLRDLRGLSLGALAEQAGGMAKSYLAKLERGEVENPGLRTLSAIAKALDVTVADLLKKAEPATTTKGKALLSNQADLERVLSALPPGLEEFLEEMTAANQPVPATTVRALASLELRGKRPRQKEDWRFLYDALTRSVRRS